MANEKIPPENNRILPTTLLVMGIILILGSSYLGYFFRIGILGPFLGRIVGLILIITSITLYVNKSHKKVYKENSFPKAMKIQYIFYSVGVIFIFASVWYFAREFIDELPDVIKLLVLIVSVVVAFIIAEFLRGGDK